MSVTLPESYLNQMKDLLKDELEDYLESYKQPRVYGLRVNTLKISVEDFLKISPFKLQIVPWCHDGFYYDGEVDKPAKHPYYYAGLYYLQEPSAMIAAEILPIEENDRVLDGCAAPGGKSTEIAAKLKDTGVLFSNDISASRCQGLLKNIELFGVRNGYVISHDLVTMEGKFENYFDKILLDVPCSGEGMFRKDPSLIKSWLERGNEYYSAIQKQIVTSALKMLKLGGMMVYSTCTFSPSEDEDIIRYMMEQCPQLKVIKIENKYECFADGIYPEMKDAIRIYPHKVSGEGHFAILLQKGEKSEEKEMTLPSYYCAIDPIAETFMKDVFVDWKNGRFEVINDKLYFLKNTDLVHKGIRMIRSGLLLGTIKKNRFEPSGAFALALRKNEYAHIIDLDSHDERVIKYLKGETIDASDKDTTTDGYVLICVDGYSLSWGKIKNGSIKNKIEVGYRWQ